MIISFWWLWLNLHKYHRKIATNFYVPLSYSLLHLYRNIDAFLRLIPITAAMPASFSFHAASSSYFKHQMAEVGWPFISPFRSLSIPVVDFVIHKRQVNQYIYLMFKWNCLQKRYTEVAKNSGIFDFRTERLQQNDFVFIKNNSNSRWLLTSSLFSLIHRRSNLWFTTLNQII